MITQLGSVLALGAGCGFKLPMFESQRQNGHENIIQNYHEHQ